MRATFGKGSAAKTVNIVVDSTAFATVLRAGPGSPLAKAQSSYGLACYHAASGGQRIAEIEDTDNKSCELVTGGTYTYFSAASVDADPGQRIGAVSVSSLRI